MNYKNLFVLSMLFIISHAFSQAEPKLPSIKSSSLGMGGSSHTINSNNKTYYVSQSIGQSGVIGTNINRDHTILQGYQFSSISIEMIPDIENNLKASLYPNPFEESIRLSFDDIIKEAIFIQVFDITGREVMSKRYPPGQIFNIQLNYISAGIYNLIVKTGHKQFVAKIIKK